MGIINEFRGLGIGSRLLEKSLKHAKDIGLEKVELSVYTSKSAAIINVSDYAKVFGSATAF